MAPKSAGKRKAPSSKPDLSNKRSAKRVKLGDARKILAEPPDKALSKNGDLDVAAFVKAREFEIRAMTKSMEQSKVVLKSRAFQQVPRELRRRTASHNVKKVPKRLRVRATREMKEDNTPTGKARRKKPDTHKRLRLEKAKELKAKGILKRKKRTAEKQSNEDAGTGSDKTDPSTSRLPSLKKNALIKPSKPPARFRKRQVNKSWLPTHVWHAKRAHMTEPQHPLWRFAIPLSPNEKTFRTTHRAATMRGCVVWDTSYMSTIGLEGAEASLLGLMRSLGLMEGVLSGLKGAKWRSGRRGHSTWIKDRDKPDVQIAPVTVFWCAVDEDLERSMSEERVKKRKRRMLLRVHPSAFFQTWDEVLKVAKMQRPQVVVEDLRFEMGSIEITGAGSTEALIAALQPVVDLPKLPSDGSQTIDTAMPDASEQVSCGDGWEDLETPQKVWTKLAGLTNPSALPAEALLAFDITDPRLCHPARTIRLPSSSQACENLLQLLADWPPDSKQYSSKIFDRKARLIACRRLSSQKSINRRKSVTPPGEVPPPLASDPSIPILLHATRQGTNTSNQGRWTLLLPWDCVLPIWYTLVHYPLSTGGVPRFGCLAQQQQIALESSSLHFPSDFPGTKAGWNWETREREVAKLEWDRKPRGRRVEFSSLDLRNGEAKGELGKGWACDWERLVLSKEAYDKLEGSEQEHAVSKAKKIEKGGKTAAAKPTDQSPQTSLSANTGPSHNLCQLPSSRLLPASLPPTALSPIHLTFPQGGHPTRRARIYRLPTAPPKLAQKWRALTISPCPSARRKAKSQPFPNPNDENLNEHQQVQALAASLLHPHPKSQAGRPGEEGTLKPGDPSYPSVPGEKDLVGFMTSGNYDLGRGTFSGVGNVILARLLAPAAGSADGAGGRGEGLTGGEGSAAAGEGEVDAMDVEKSNTPTQGAGKARGAKGKRKEKKEKDGMAGWVIVRDAGQSVGRIARWELARE